jgi:hypothetical protein
MCPELVEGRLVRRFDGLSAHGVPELIEVNVP